jgi:hypothetical protein
MKLHFQPGTAHESFATIQLSNIRLNGLYVDPQTAWAMPNPVGIQRVDLSKTAMVPTFAPTASGQTAAETQSRLPFRGKWLNR